MERWARTTAIRQCEGFTDRSITVAAQNLSHAMKSCFCCKINTSMNAHPTLSRRRFLAASAAVNCAGESPAQHKIASVKAYPIKVAGMAGGAVPKFTSDFDRARWIGPFSQLGGAILVEIKTEQGLTGYGMGGGGGAAAFIIEHHLGPLITGASALNVEAIWEQMYSSTLLYGRKGVTIMAISGVDNALWDIRGKHAGQPV